MGNGLGYMWDNPEIVAIKDCRYDVGLEVDAMKPSTDSLVSLLSFRL